MMRAVIPPVVRLLHIKDLVGSLLHMDENRSDNTVIRKSMARYLDDLPVPGSDTPSEKIFDYAFLHDHPTINYLNSHGHVMFIIRGPPGTGKEALADMILSRYPSSKLLSAKDYFKQPLAVGREKNGAKLSHEWCYKRTVEACNNGTKVIVLRNTNVRKWEIERYLHLAQDYGYTIIIADASKKFQFNPEILAKSNTQGLNPEYFKSRLCQWDEVVPWYTGWFLSPADSQWVENNIRKHLSALLKFPEFRTDFSFHSNDDIDKDYKKERELFCIAGYCACSKSGECHYLNKQVQNEIGKVSDLVLAGYLVTSEMILAVIGLSSEQGEIARIGKPENSDACDPLSNMLQRLQIQSHREPKNTTAPSPIPSQETVKSEDQHFNGLLTTNLSYIVIKHNSAKSFPYIEDIDKYSKEIFSEMKGKTSVSVDNFSFSTDEIKVCQLKQRVWLVCLLRKYTVQSVFSGLYS